MSDEVLHKTVKEMTCDVKAERNTKGYNVTASVHDAKSPEEAMAMLEDAMRRLEQKYPVVSSG